MTDELKKSAFDEMDRLMELGDGINAYRDVLRLRIDSYLAAQARLSRLQRDYVRGWHSGFLCASGVAMAIAGLIWGFLS